MDEWEYQIWHREYEGGDPPNFKYTLQPPDSIRILYSTHDTYFLNDVGSEGWGLVTICDWEDTSGYVAFYFKRKRQ